MTDVTAGTPSADQNTATPPANPPAVEDDAPEDVVAQAPAEGEEAPEGDEGEPAEPDEVEIDHEGIKAKVPKALKDAFLRQQDYTRKTQALAEERRAAEAQVQQASQVLWTQFKEAAALDRIDNELAAYKDVIWPEWYRQNPRDAQIADAQYRQLKDQRGEAAAKLQQAVQTSQQMEQQATQQRLQATAEYARKEIPGWNDELDTRIHKFIREQGFSDEDILSVMSPATYRIMHLAMIGDQVTRKVGARAAAPRPSAAESADEAPPPQPLKTVSSRNGSANATKPSDKDSVEAWLEKRNKQLANKRRA